MRTSRSTLTILAAFAALGGFLSFANAQSVATTPVGAISFSSAAAPVGGQSYAYNAISLVKPILFVGTLDSQVNGATTTVGDTDGAWATAALNSGSRYPTHYVEILSGPAAGLTFDIISSDAATKSLVLDSNLTSFNVVGSTYHVRKHWTLGDLFGVATPVGIKRGNATTADLVSVWTGAGYTSFYHRQSATQNGWRSTNSVSEDESLAVVYPEQGVFFKRMDPTPLNVTYVGEVRPEMFGVSIAQGFNLISALSAKDITLADSGLFTGVNSSGVKPGNATTADTISIWNGSAFVSYYVRSTGAGLQGWRSTDNVTADASLTVIPAGSSVVVRRKTDVPSFVWSRPAQSL